jgi:dTDP-4-dehydrorhamnose 3,5-epimerase
MDVTALAIAEVKLLRPHRRSDDRGYFVELWNRRTLAGHGIAVDFVQDNCSFSRAAGTIRGMHYQAPPAAQAKLVRVVRGSVLDVAIDLRRGAPSFGRYVAAELTADGGEQLFIPVGFAHGYCTLEPDSEVAYKVSDFYSRECERGILWSDPDIAVDWPLQGRDPILSDKDATLPRLVDAESPF